MKSNARDRSAREHKLLVQAVCLALILALPVPLFFAAKAGNITWVWALMASVAACMVTTIWVG